MNTPLRIVAAAALALSATGAASAQGLFGPSAAPGAPSHDFAPAKKAEVPESKAPAKAAPAARETRRPAPSRSESSRLEPTESSEPGARDESEAPVAAAPETDMPAAAPVAAPAPVAQDDDTIPFMHEGENASESDAPSAGGLVVRTIGALLLVVGMLVGAAFAMRRLGGPRFGAARPDGPELAVLSSVALGDRRSLTVVKFGERTLLLGSTTTGITLLAEDDDDPPTPVRSVGYLLEADTETTFDDELVRASDRSRGGLLS